jgi:hypothetical protein
MVLFGNEQTHRRQSVMVEVMESTRCPDLSAADNRQSISTRWNTMAADNRIGVVNADHGSA